MAESKPVLGVADTVCYLRSPRTSLKTFFQINVSQSKHSYPFCWRSDTPLLYRAVPAWFMRVQQVSLIISQLLGSQLQHCSLIVPVKLYWKETILSWLKQSNFYLS